MVPDDTVQKGTNCPAFDKWGILTLYITTSLYLIDPFSFLFSILHYRLSVGEGPMVGAHAHRPPGASDCNNGTQGSIFIATLDV